MLHIASALKLIGVRWTPQNAFRGIVNGKDKGLDFNNCACL